MQEVIRVANGTVCAGDQGIERVARVLRSGGLALIPTETVYGLSAAVAPLVRDAASGVPACAADARDDGMRIDERRSAHRTADTFSRPLVNGAPVPPEGSGYRRIFTVKHRSLAQTVPWLVDGVGALDRYGRDVDPVTRSLAQAFWPGALTLVVRAHEGIPRFLQAADGTIALRCSASPVVAALIEACSSPLATTSANTHGAPAPAAFLDIEPAVLAGVDIAVDAGETPCRDASTIVSCLAGRPSIIRCGALDPEAIERVAAAAGANDTPTREM